MDRKIEFVCYYRGYRIWEVYIFFFITNFDGEMVTNEAGTKMIFLDENSAINFIRRKEENG